MNKAKECTVPVWGVRYVWSAATVRDSRRSGDGTHRASRQEAISVCTCENFAHSFMHRRYKRAAERSFVFQHQLSHQRESKRTTPTGTRVYGARRMWLPHGWLYSSRLCYAMLPRFMWPRLSRLIIFRTGRVNASGATTRPQ